MYVIFKMEESDRLLRENITKQKQLRFIWSRILVLFSYAAIHSEMQAIRWRDVTNSNVIIGSESLLCVQKSYLEETNAPTTIYQTIVHFGVTSSSCFWDSFVLQAIFDDERFINYAQLFIRNVHHQMTQRRLNGNRSLHVLHRG